MLYLDPVGWWCVCNDVQYQISNVVDMDSIFSPYDLAIHIHKPGRLCLHLSGFLCFASLYACPFCLRAAVPVHLWSLGLRRGMDGILGSFHLLVLVEPRFGVLAIA